MGFNYSHSLLAPSFLPSKWSKAKLFSVSCKFSHFLQVSVMISALWADGNWDLRCPRDLAKGEITHMGIFGAAVHISTALTVLCSIWEGLGKGRMSFHPNVDLQSPKPHRLNPLNPSRAGQDTCTSHLQLFSLESQKKCFKYSNFMSHVKVGLDDPGGLLQP